MNYADAEEYTAALGQSFGGNYRLVKLAVDLEVPQTLGLSVRDWVETRLGGYVKMAIPERQSAVAELAADGMTQRQIADVLGVANGTVAADVAAQNRADDGDDQEEHDSSAQNRADDPPPPLEESMEKLDRAAEYLDVLDADRAYRERVAEQLRDESTPEMNELRELCRRLLDLIVVIDHLPAHEQSEAADLIQELQKEIARHA